MSLCLENPGYGGHRNGKGTEAMEHKEVAHDVLVRPVVTNETAPPSKLPSLPLIVQITKGSSPSSSSREEKSHLDISYVTPERKKPGRADECERYSSSLTILKSPYTNKISSIILDCPGSPKWHKPWEWPKLAPIIDVFIPISVSRAFFFIVQNKIDLLLDREGNLNLTCCHRRLLN